MTNFGPELSALSVEYKVGTAKELGVGAAFETEVETEAEIEVEVGTEAEPEFVFDAETEATTETGVDTDTDLGFVAVASYPDRQKMFGKPENEVVTLVAVGSALVAV